MNKKNSQKDIGAVDGKEVWWRKAIKVFGVEASVMMIVGVLIGIIATYFYLSKQDYFIQPLIANSVSATVAAQPTTTLPTAIPTVNVTPTSQTTQATNQYVFLDNSAPVSVFSYQGGNDSQVQGRGTLIVRYDENGEIGYTLDYELPEPETWAGIAIKFDQPTNLAQYNYIKVVITFSDPIARCEVKFVDREKNDILSLKEAETLGTGVDIDTDGGRQVITIPLRENFDVNFEQITEISFIVNSDLGSGTQNFTIFNIEFLK